MKPIERNWFFGNTQEQAICKEVLFFTFDTDINVLGYLLGVRIPKYPFKSYNCIFGAFICVYLTLHVTMFYDEFKISITMEKYKFPLQIPHEVW